MALVLGVAFGPRATQVEVRHATRGTLVASGHARHVDLGPDVDVDDPTAWWRSLVAAVGQAGEREIAAISVCGSHPGLVLLDGAGAVLRPLQPWAEAAGERDAARLRSALGAERWARRAGMLPAARSAITRLAWLRRTDPATLERVGAALLPHDWLTYRLAGRPVTDRGSASLTGAWSPGDEAWIPEVLAELDPTTSAASWARRLPTVLGPAEPADWLTAPVYELLGLRGRPLVAPGTGEAMAVALALGASPGRLALSLGSATTVLAGLDAPVADPSGVVRSRADAAGGHLAISTVGGGAALPDSIAALLDLDVEALAELARSGAPQGELLLVPGVAGRSGGVLTGIVPGVTRADLARAAFDGVACAALDAVDQVVAAGAPWADDEPLRLAAPARGLHAQAQALATLGDRPVITAPQVSLAAAGACIQAAAVLTDTDPAEVAEVWDLVTGATVEPEDDPDRLAPSGGPRRGAAPPAPGVAAARLTCYERVRKVRNVHHGGAAPPRRSRPAPTAPCVEVPRAPTPAPRPRSSAPRRRPARPGPGGRPRARPTRSRRRRGHPAARVPGHRPRLHQLVRLLRPGLVGDGVVHRPRHPGS
jgi:xylulokinase